jgi:hypothetical protein
MGFPHVSGEARVKATGFVRMLKAAVKEKQRADFEILRGKDPLTSRKMVVGLP